MPIIKKLKKLIKHPKLYFFDYIGKRISDDDFIKSYSYKNKMIDTNKLKNKNKMIDTNKLKNKKSVHFYDIFNDQNEVFPEKLSGTKNYIYLPWIKSHTDILINSIFAKSNSFTIHKLNIFKDLAGDGRKKASKYINENILEYKRYLYSVIIPVCKNIKGCIFTFEWSPVTRILEEVCNNLGLFTLLIPHEFVFLDAEKFYWHEITNAKLPISDYILGLGNLHKNIFIPRGYPENRYINCNSTKLDDCINFTPKISYDDFILIYGFQKHKKIILFAAQNFDIQIDRKMALNGQRKIINDLIDYCIEHNHQLIIRQPPNGNNVLNKDLLDKIEVLDSVYVDDSYIYLTSAQESIYHSDCVVAINSTMLIEAKIMLKPTIAIHYFIIESILDKYIKSIATNRDELFELLNENLNKQNQYNDKSISTMISTLAESKDDIYYENNIPTILENICNGQEKYKKDYNDLEKFVNHRQLDVVSIPSNPELKNSKQLYLKKLLYTNTLLDKESFGTLKLSAVQVFFIWGIKESKSKSYIKSLAKQMCKPIVYLEDGFIRSIGLGISGAPTLSIIYDDIAPYYDARQASRLEMILSSDEQLQQDQLEYAQKCINMITTYSLTKYNCSPIINLSIGTNKKKILLVDQRYGDMSVECGLANEQTFQQMLYDAINNYSDCDIIIKQHPDSLTGKYGSYFNQSVLSVTKHMKNAYIVDYDVNPYSLLRIVDEVMVCSSQMGFEALMLGKTVHCYGMPFYAGWGVTDDKISIPRRKVHRSIVEIFHYAYIHMSRYVTPESEGLTDLVSLLNYIKTHR